MFLRSDGGKIAYIGERVEGVLVRCELYSFHREDLVRRILFSEDDLETGVGGRVNELCHAEKCW